MAIYLPAKHAALRRVFLLLVVVAVGALVVGIGAGSAHAAGSSLARVSSAPRFELTSDDTSAAIRCAASGYQGDPLDPEPGEACDNLSPDLTGCAYLPGRVLLQQVYVAAAQVWEQLFYSSACGGVSWTRIVWPNGNPGYDVGIVDVDRFGTAEGGYSGENDGSAWWSHMIGAVPGDCIETDVDIARDGQEIPMPQLQDCF